MTFIKKNIGPILFITTILTINTILWISAVQAAYLNNGVLQTSLLGSTLLMGFFIIFLLATKSKFMIKIFGGLENVYFWHRLLAILTTALIFIHAEFAISGGSNNILNFLFFGEVKDAGELARNGFILLIGIALLAKYFKYEHFKIFHRLMIVPYLIAVYHSFGISWINLFSFSPISIWMLSTSSIAIASSMYMLIIYPYKAFKHHGYIIDIQKLTSDIIELKVKMKKTYKFKPGQFAFIKIKDHKNAREIHPFSISGQDDNYLYFTIKSLGDYTKNLISLLKTPASISITRPYGHMTFHSKKAKQIWVAGGIGITPFLGALRSNEMPDKPIHLFYSVRNEQETVHLDKLIEFENTYPNFKFTLHDTSKSGYINQTHLPIDPQTVVYMCGPTPMVDSLKKQILQNLPDTEIHYEAFRFTGKLVEDVLKITKKVYRKLVTTK